MPIDAVHAHLVLNHAPVVGSVFAVILLAFGVWLKKEETTRVALVATALIGLLAVVVYLTGEPAEEAVESLAGISERLIESHEEVALVATIASTVAGAGALAALVFFRKRPIPRTASSLVLVLALVGAGTMGYTAWRGGQIRHSEIRGSGFTPASAALVDSAPTPTDAVFADYEERAAHAPSAVQEGR